MTNLQGVTEWLIAIAAIIGAITTLVITIKKFWKEIEPFWYNVLKPVLKFVAVLLTLIIPNGIIIWAFILHIAVNLTPGIKNRDVFLSVVFWLTICVSVCSLVWGMWFYPAIIRPRFNKQKTKKPTKENKVNENEVDENKNQNQNIQSPNVAELNQPLNNQGGGTL